jgi:hypothetical protein
MILKVFHKIERKECYPIPFKKPDYQYWIRTSHTHTHTHKEKLQTNFSDEHRCNKILANCKTAKLNDPTARSDWFYSRYAKMVKHMQINKRNTAHK